MSGGLLQNVQQLLICNYMGIDIVSSEAQKHHKTGGSLLGYRK